MRKMLLKGLLFLIILIIPLMYFNMRYKKTDFFLQMNGLGKFRNIPYEIEVVNLGNSHAAAGIMYNDKSFKGYNWALGSQPFEYDYYILDYYSSHLSKKATVIIQISFFDWYYNYEEIFEGEISRYNERYYSILDKNHIMNYDLKKDFLYNRFPLLTAGKNMTYIFEDVKQDDVVQDNAETNTDLASLERVAEEKYESWTEHVMAVDANKKEQCKIKNMNFLKKIIDYCYENEYTPVLVTLPMTNQLLEKFSEDFVCDFNRQIMEVQKEYPKLKFFDYSEDQDFAGNPQLFMNLDSDHLNEDGADIFSERLWADLRKAKLIK